MGTPSEWYGALVGIEHGEHTELGFDDGDVQLMPTCSSELEENFDEKIMLPAVPSDGGLVANRSGHSGRAVAFLKYSNGMQTKTIGLVIGDAEMPKIAGHVVYSEVHVREDAFVQARATRGLQSIQDRHGLHSFGRGDLVEYTQAKQDEVPPVTCCVYGCIEASAVSDDNQICRILVLYDIQLDILFLSTWPAWRRVPKVGLGVDLVCDNDDHVQMAEREVVLKMQAAFPLSLASGSLMGIGTRYKMKNKAAEAPPRLKPARAEATRVETERKKEEERAEKAAEKAKEKAAAEKAKAKAAAAEAAPKKVAKAAARRAAEEGGGGGASASALDDSPQSHKKRRKGKHKRKRKHSSSSGSSSGDDASSPKAKHARGSPSSSCGTPYEVVKAREELAALEAAAAARLRAKIDRHERKKHEKKHKHHR